jgi:hypothetical protein
MTGNDQSPVPSALAQSRATGVFWCGLGWAVKVLGLTVGWAAIFVVEAKWPGGDKHAYQPLMDLVISVLVLIGYGISRVGGKQELRGRRHLAPVLASPRQLPDRSFVLYLRSFTDDSSRAETEVLMWPGPMGVILNLTASRQTQEEQLAAALSAAGPVVALGRPGDRLPGLGACRMYVPDDGWRETIVDLLRRARLVVMVLGPGRNLEWELVQAVRIVPPERLALFVFMPSASYPGIRKVISRAFAREARQLRRQTGEDWSPPALPEYPRGVNRLDAGWMIAFDQAWVSSSSVLPGSNVYVEYPLPTLVGAFRVSVSRAMQRVFRRLSLLDGKEIPDRSSAQKWRYLPAALFPFVGSGAALVIWGYAGIGASLIFLSGFILFGVAIVVITELRRLP